MKKVILPLIALGAVYFGIKAFTTELAEPAEGVVVMAQPVTLTPSITITGTTVPTEAEVDSTMVVVVDDPVMRPIDPQVNEFMPLPFTGKKLNKFAKKFGGKVIRINNQLATALVRVFGLDQANLPSSVVKVNGALYFKAKDGTLYVTNEGELVIIDNIEDEQTITAAQLADALQPIVGRDLGGLTYTAVYASGNTLHLDLNLEGAAFNSVSAKDITVFKDILLKTFAQQGTSGVLYANNINLSITLSVNGNYLAQTDVYSFELNPYLLNY